MSKKFAKIFMLIIFLNVFFKTAKSLTNQRKNKFSIRRETNKNFETLKIGFRVKSNISQEQFMHNISRKYFFPGQITKTLVEYFVERSKTFEKASFLLTQEQNVILKDGTLKGMIKFLNNSEIDISPNIFLFRDKYIKLVDYAYPFKHFYGTFMILEPEYKPEVLGIFKTITPSVWITILTVSVFMFLSHYFILKRNCAFHKIMLHYFAIFFRQGCILRPSSMAEKILTYSWVFGAMFLCLAYDSIFLSFLSIPPVLKIKDIPQLTSAVANGDYHCIAIPGSATYTTLITSTEKNLRIIGKDLQNSNLIIGTTFVEFIYEKIKTNIAVLSSTDGISFYNFGRKYVSEDSFFVGFGAMMVRKDFCCKEMLETFVHRLMASGLYFKFHDDTSFFTKLTFIKTYLKKDTSMRILTLTDVAPAFLFLLTGYLISVLVLIGEIIWNRRKKDTIKVIQIEKRK